MIKTFLFDANTFIAPFNSYYAFDITPNYWDNVKKSIGRGEIVVLDKVYDEVVKGDDELSEWMIDVAKDSKLSCAEPNVIAKYREILMYVQNSGFYKAKALSEWSSLQVADPWLIASAIVHKQTIVTFETPNGNLNANYPSSRPKIPDVSKAFDVECKNLFEIMRVLSITP